MSIELAKHLRYEVRRCMSGFYVVSPRERMYSATSHPHRQFFKTEEAAWEVAGIRAVRMQESNAGRSERAKLGRGVSKQRAKELDTKVKI